MAKTALVFPGQGSQKVGMGAELREKHPGVYDRYFALADELSGQEIRRIVEDGPAEDLTATDVAQPALFAMSLAVAELATEAGITPDYVAGHSLGEYTAATAAGALGLEDGMRLVARRGRLMADIQLQSPGSMAAVIGLEIDAVEKLCADVADAGDVAPANLNTPAQIVVSGESTAIDKLVELAPEAGAKRAVKLQVGAAFHSRMMKPVQRELASAMSSIVWSDPRVPVASNASGKLVTSAADLRQALIDQIASPVLWVDCVRALVGAGCRTFLELGPGRVLGGLVRQIDPDLEVAAADSAEKLAAFQDSR